MESLSGVGPELLGKHSVGEVSLHAFVFLLSSKHTHVVSSKSWNAPSKSASIAVVEGAWEAHDHSVPTMGNPVYQIPKLPASYRNHL